MESLKKFQNLLKELFQFDSSDLDFGIYRIFQQKREEIEKFINHTLQERVRSKFTEMNREALAKEFEEVTNEIKRSLGEQALSPEGELKEAFRNTPLGQKYLTLQEQMQEAAINRETEIQIYNDLYEFFSRYYEEGDFLPRYRYAFGKHIYAIPYNGEEIKLHWVNAGQYYIKTGYLFRDYAFRVDGYRVVFRIVSAREESGSKKALKERFFVPGDNPVEEKDGELLVRFEFRELGEEEVKEYELDGGSTAAKQEKINAKMEKKILELAGSKIKHLLEKNHKGGTLLGYHLRRFTAKNTRDYFIHRNLGEFLNEQLDYYIKSEILDTGTLLDKQKYEKHILRARLVKEIGETIIDFLAQIEDFQKRLWEKKKFIIRTDYVITLDKLYEFTGKDAGYMEKIIPEILKNRDQIEEWKTLGFGEIRSREDLVAGNGDKPVFRKLPLDTRYFPPEFKEELLEKVTENHDLEKILDGVLVKSENWQALNLLREKYREKVQTIYIDPPFNKEQDADYLYNVKYKDSTWMTLLENRLRLAKDFLGERGSIFVRCDYNGNWLVRALLDEIFGKENFRNEIDLKRTKTLKGEEKKFHTSNDTLFFYSKKFEKMNFNGYRKLKTKAEWVRMHIPVSVKGDASRVFFGKKINPPEGRKWVLSQEAIDKAIEQGLIKWDDELNEPLFLSQNETVGSDWTDISSYSFDWNFKTENSEILLKRVIESTSREGDIVMDFFLGSGTTAAVAHKLKRKWIGVEMGDHFWTVIMPRMKKVLAYDDTGISREKDVKAGYNKDTAGGFFRYLILEQYEDTLDNLELKENRVAKELFQDEYLLKYFTGLETRESPYYLSIDDLQNPFQYRLKVNLYEMGEPEETVIDIPGTFACLLGVSMRKVKVRYNDGRKYLFQLGKYENQDRKEVAIVWREYGKHWNSDDYLKDAEFLKQELAAWSPEVLYVNGRCVLQPESLPGVREINSIEPVFKRLLKGGR